MAKWTVALFGYYKPQDLGWEKRAKPGDVIAFKPYGEDWTKTEKKEFLIVTIEGPSKDQMSALCEPLWDIKSWDEDEKEAKIGDEVYPNKYTMKRRFTIHTTTLTSRGVELDKMLNKDLLYAPAISDFSVTEVYDNLNNRTVSLTDKLELVKPRIKSEVIK